MIIHVTCICPRWVERAGCLLDAPEKVVRKVPGSVNSCFASLSDLTISRAMSLPLPAKAPTVSHQVKEWRPTTAWQTSSPIAATNLLMLVNQPCARLSTAFLEQTGIDGTGKGQQRHKHIGIFWAYHHCVITTLHVYVAVDEWQPPLGSCITPAIPLFCHQKSFSISPHTWHTALFYFAEFSGRTAQFAIPRPEETLSSLLCSSSGSGTSSVA